MNPALIFAFLVVMLAFQRLFELKIAKKNTQNLLSQGAQEYAPGHYPVMVALHSGWLIALIAQWPQVNTVHFSLLLLFLVLQAGRVWVVKTLGPYWTTRIIRAPQAPIVETGPFRWVKHPNYLIVFLEIIIFPLIFELYLTSLVFGILNGGLLIYRIRKENEALSKTHHVPFCD